MQLIRYNSYFHSLQDGGPEPKIGDTGSRFPEAPELAAKNQMTSLKKSDSTNQGNS